MNRRRFLQGMTFAALAVALPRRLPPVAPVVLATGGAVGSFGPYLVGERGPELLFMPYGGTVIPNSALREYLRSVTA